MIVADAGALVSSLAVDNALGRAARRRLRGEDLVAPELIDIEVVSALRRLARHREITPMRAANALQTLLTAELTRVSHSFLLRRCWQLRHALTIYDASYVALAELLHVPLVTTDRRLARAPGPRCPIELLELPPDDDLTLRNGLALAGPLAGWLIEDPAVIGAVDTLDADG